MSHKHLRLNLLLMSLILPGCGSGGPTVVPVTGTVTRNGNPVAHVHLDFMPEAGGRPSWGVTNEQGQFTLEYDPQQKGAEVGKHKVAVKFRPSSPKAEFELRSGKIRFHPDQKAIEAKYGNLETTPLEVDVKSGQPLMLQLD
jgi:hypothetical protein